jgi:nucleoside-diphosphate-sugar epimerase
MKIIITGANGFVGRHLVPKLLNNDHEVLQVTTNPDRSHALFGDEVERFQYGQGRHEELKKQVLSFKPDVCIHLASYLTAADDFQTLHKLLDANITFTCNILDALKESSLKAFINTGTFAEYYKGDMRLDPAYLYTATKTASRVFVDYYSKTYHFKQITIAPYTIYGGIDTQKKIIDIIYDSLSSEDPLQLTEGRQMLDFIHVDDVTDFFVLTAENFDKVQPGACFHLGTGIGHTLRDLVSLIEKASGKKANIGWGAKDYRPRDVMYAVANTSLQYHLFGWRPKISLGQGIKSYLENKDKA